VKIRCRLGYHAPSGWATKAGVFGAGTCRRCFQPVGGIAIDNTPPRPMQAPKAKRVAPAWLRAVYERKSS
jgi:hypothetical protein